MNRLRVKGWATFQHYKRRSPAWIKLHRTLLTDMTFSDLSETTRFHLLMIWLLSADADGVVPENQAHLARMIGATSYIDLDAMVDAGFLIREQDASRPLAELSSHRREVLEKLSPSRGEERRGKEATASFPPPSENEKVLTLIKPEPALGEPTQTMADFTVELERCKAVGLGLPLQAEVA